MEWRSTHVVGVVVESSCSRWTYMVFRLGPQAGAVRRVPPTVIETRADCRVACSLETLIALVTGALKPLTAVLSGAITVTGDRKAFVTIGPALRRAAKSFLEEHPTLITSKLTLRYTTTFP
jgi:hypothetical protein